MKFIWMTDLHIRGDGAALHGRRPSEYLRAVLGEIDTRHSDADYLVLTGDLVDDGSDESYKALQAELNTLSLKVLPVIGNHDSRSGMRALFHKVGFEDEVFLHHSLVLEKTALIFLDSVLEGHDEGFLCESRMDWLEKTLDACGQRDIYLFLHHPPVKLGIVLADEMGLQNSGELMSLLKRYQGLRHIFFGHAHRSVSGTFAGVPFAGLGSTLYQLPTHSDWTWKTLVPEEGGPQFAVVSIEDGSVVIHYQQLDLPVRSGARAA